MDPLTITVAGIFLLMMLIGILGILQIGAKTPGADDLGMGRTNCLPRIRTNELLVLQFLSMVGVPVLMIGFSVALPALRNPLLLGIGALVGLFLPRSWLSGSTFGRMALVAGLLVLVVWFALVLMLRST
jgi:hypothetical protein